MERTLAAPALERLAPFLEDLEAQTDSFVLPRAEEGSVTWYGMARSDRGFRTLRNELLAWLGPTYSDFNGSPTPLHASDPVEAAILKEFGERAIRLRICDRSTWEEARAALLLRRKVIATRPTRSIRSTVPTGRLVSHFEEALRLGALEEASQVLNQLRSQGRLDARNLLFLKNLSWEASADWQSMFSATNLAELLPVRRPRRVNRGLIRGLYLTEIKPFEKGVDVEGARQTFKSLLSSGYSALFKPAPDLSAREVRAALMLKACCKEPADFELGQRVLEQPSIEANERLWLEAIFATALTWDGPEPPPGTNLQRAAQYLEAGRPESAWAALEPEDLSFEATLLRLRCADALGGLDSLQEAVKAVLAAPSSVQEQLRGNAQVKRLLDEFQALVPDASLPNRIPGDWLEWVRSLDNPSFEHSTEIAEAGSVEWQTGALATNDVWVRKLSKEIADLKPNGVNRLQNALPFLLATFEPFRNQSFTGPLYQSLLLVVLQDEAPSNTYFLTVYDILEGALSTGLTETDYEFFVRALADQVTAFGAPSNHSHLVDVVDLLSRFPCPSEDVLIALLTVLSGQIVRHRSRSGLGLLTLMADLHKTFGVPPVDDLALLLTEQSDERSSSQYLKGRTVALYSLLPPVLDRVERSLQALEPSVTVRKFCDTKGGSAPLKSAARTADLFVVATSAATHAATDFIAAHRDRTSPTLRPAGKGSGSMMRSIEEYVSSLN